MLLECDCDAAQGYLFSRPAPAGELAELLSDSLSASARSAVVGQSVRASGHGRVASKISDRSRGKAVETSA